MCETLLHERSGASVRIITTVGDMEAAAGTEQSQLRIFSDLRRRGHEIAVLYPEVGSRTPGWREVATIAHRVTMSGILQYYFGRSGKELRQWLLTSQRERVVYIHHSGYSYNLAVGLAISALTRSPLVVHIHLPYGANYPIPKFALKLLSSICASAIYVSNHTRQQWTDHGFASARSVSIANGIDCDLFMPATASRRSAARGMFGLPSDAYTVGMFGRLTMTKGIGDLCQAWWHVCDGKWNAHLLLAGTPEKTTQPVMAALPHTTHIKWVDDPRVLYDAVDLVVVPSRWPEPNALVLIEALASGVPVIATDVGGTRETIGEWVTGTGIPLVSAGSPKELAGALVECITMSKDRYKLVSSEARAFAVHKQSLSASVAAIEEELKLAIARRSR